MSGESWALTKMLRREMTGRSIPPEQGTPEATMSRRRFACDRTISLIVVVLTCVTLTITTLVRLENVQELLFSNSSQIIRALRRFLGRNATSSDGIDNLGYQF
jgi:hypothetical protein